MAFFASYLRHLLMLLDMRAEIAASPSQEALSRLGRIDEGDAGHRPVAGRPHPLVVRAMKIARHRKAHTLAIVDATLSEVSKLSERTLYYSSNSPAFVRSHAGLLSLIQALAYGVYSRDAAQYDDRIGVQAEVSAAVQLGGEVDRADARLVGQLGEHLADHAVHVRLVVAEVGQHRSQRGVRRP